MRRTLNPTLTGLFPVLFWGLGVPMGRLFMERIGPVAYMGLMFSGVASLGMASNLLRHGRLLKREVFRSPVFYGRWFFFAVYPVLLNVAISIVHRDTLPLVILLNYLWPTAVIFFSILVAHVRVRRPLALLGGSALVIGALAIEIVGPAGAWRALDGADALAALMAFTGALCWGLYSALSRRGGDTAGGSSAIPLFQLTLALALPLSLTMPASHWQALAGWWASLLVLYCVLQFFAYQAWDLGMRKGNIVVLSLCADFIPWLSLLATHFLLGVAVGPWTILSALLLVAGAMITRLGTRQQQETFAELE